MDIVHVLTLFGDKIMALARLSGNNLKQLVLMAELTFDIMMQDNIDVVSDKPLFKF